MNGSMIGRNPTTCDEWMAELVECARRSGHERQPGRELRAHLASCTQCRERWDAELMLNAHFRTIRSRTAALRSPESRRESLMRDFAKRHRRGGMRSWTWGLTAAATVVLAVVAGYLAGGASKKTAAGTSATGYQTVSFTGSDTLSTDASALSTDDFIAVPYTPPLAPGEMVRVVHANLYPEALASMGVDVDPASTGRLPADVVIGEDGLPRAVRLADGSGSF